MAIKQWRLSLTSLFLLVSLIPLSAQANTLDLATAIKLATQDDPWLRASEHKQAAMLDQSTAASTLPDPVLSLSLANLPTDDFSFDQENMTQFKLGIAQKFARGDSLALKQKQLKLSSQTFPLLRLDRSAKVEAMVSELWFNSYRASKTISLIEQDKTLFSQLARIVESRYSSVVGKVRQQDIVRAQLELTRLEDRLQVLRQQYFTSKSALARWLPAEYIELEIDSQPLNQQTSHAQLSALQMLKQDFAKHPAVQVWDVRIKASQTGVAIAEQGYKPEFGVNASYGYRDDMENGTSRADFFSVGVSFDVPLFTDNKQDKLVSAAISEKEAAKTERLLLMQELFGAHQKEYAQLQQLIKREQLFTTQLLPQMAEQSDAALNAYTSDQGDFSEVMRARIAQLNAKIDALNIQVDQHIMTARIQYYLLGQERLKKSKSQDKSKNKDKH